MIDIYDPQIMTEALITNFPPHMFLTNTFFGTSKTYDGKSVTFDVKKGKRRMSPFVSRTSQGKVVARTGYKTNKLEPPYIKEKRVTTSDDVLERQAGDPVYIQGGGNTPAERAARILAEDVTEMQQDLNRRIEWMASKSLFTGIVPVVGDGVSIQIDFGFEAAQKKTLTTTARWTEDTATIIKDLTDWKRQIKQLTGKIVRKVVLGRNAAESLENNATIQALLNNRRTEAGQLEYRSLPEGAEYIGYLAKPGVELFTYDEWYYDEDTETEIEMVPENQVVMVGEGARLRRHYAVISDLKAGNFRVETFVKSWEVEDPSVRFVMLQSAPVTAIEEPEAVVVTTVQDAE